MGDEDSVNKSLILCVLEKLHNKNKLFTFIKFPISITSQDSMYASDKLLWKGDPVKKLSNSQFKICKLGIQLWTAEKKRLLARFSRHKTAQRRQVHNENPTNDLEKL